MARNITIIGLGLIGCSIGLALKQFARTTEGQRLAITVTGYDANIEAQKEALKREVIDKTPFKLDSALAEADLVVVAAPPGVIDKIFREIGPLLRPGTIVTDTASTKREIMASARRFLPPEVSFVGGHPMAGGEGGASSARADLFNKATWCIDLPPAADSPSLGLVNWLVEEVCGAFPLFISDFEHDSFVAAVSHLPFIASIALMDTVSDSPNWGEMQRVAAKGLSDLSRLSSASPEMHRDICIGNRDMLLHWIDRYQDTLAELRTMIAALPDRSDGVPLRAEASPTTAKADQATVAESAKPEEWVESPASNALLTRFEQIKRTREDWLSQRQELQTQSNQPPSFLNINDQARQDLDDSKGAISNLFLGGFAQRRIRGRSKKDEGAKS